MISAAKGEETSADPSRRISHGAGLSENSRLGLPGNFSPTYDGFDLASAEGVGENSIGSYDFAVSGLVTAKDPILFGGGQWNLYGYSLNDPVNVLDLTGLAPFVNNSGSPIVVSGNPGGGHGGGAPVQFTVPPGGRVDANNPFMTPQGPVTDVDAIDFNQDGTAIQSGMTDLFPRGEKVVGGDRGLVCGVTENPFPIGPPVIPYPAGYVP